ncbi:MAG: HAMP domain-containing protein [Dehalococcoidia bacterium]|nr:MAG: HAMP domain-containing protein [Dehalococcoidia bacterium]
MTATTIPYAAPIELPHLPEKVKRFSVWQRVQHWMLAFVFLSLVATGLPQKFNDAGVSVWIVNTLGGIDNVRFFHRVLAVTFIIESALHAGEIGVAMLRRRFRPTMMFTLQDFRDAFNMLLYSLGFIHERPTFDRYDYRQKFEYWGILAGAVIMIATGATLWFPTYVTKLAPGQFIPAAKEMHSGEALLALLVIVIWHFYDVVISPAVFPLDTAMITGSITGERMHEEHGREYARIAARQASAIPAVAMAVAPGTPALPRDNGREPEAPWGGVIRRQLHLRVTMLVAIGMAGVLVALTITALFPVNRSIDRTLDERRSLALVTARQADFVVRQGMQTLEAATTGAEFDLRDADPAPERSALRRALANSVFSRVYITDAEGKVLWVEPPLDPSREVNFAAYAPESMLVLGSRKPSVSGLSTSIAGGGPIVSIVSPVTGENGAAIGLVAGDIALDGGRLAEIVEPAALGKTGYAQIVDSRGNVLASSRPGQILERSDHEGQIASLIQQGRATSGTCHECHVAAGQQQRSTDVMAFAPLDTAPWAVLIRQSEDEALAPARTLRQRAIMFGVPAVLVAVLFSWLVARSVLRPIGVLTTAANRIAAGDLSQPVPELGRDEVGGLARTFEAMRVRLRQSQEAIWSWNRQLEDRVRERTHELEVSRDSLRSAAEEKAALFEELRRKEAARGELLRKVITAQEEERRRIARELHDETGQALSALVVGMDAATLAGESDMASIRKRLVDLRAVTVDALEDVHRLIYDLRPSLLDDVGLVAGLRWYAETRLQSSGVTSEVMVMGEEKRLPAEVETALFRIGQEAISNVAWHAKATNALVTLDFRDGGVTLSVEDDGAGFEVASVSETSDQRRGWGILGMRERAELLGGTLRVSSRKGEGTTVKVTVPLHGGGDRDGEDTRPHR